MRHLPWRLSLRADRRALLTTLGVALGVVFTIISLSVPQGLQTETVSPEGPFGHQDALVAHRAFEPFDPHTANAPQATGYLVVDATTSDGAHVRLVAMEGPRAVLIPNGTFRPSGVAAPSALTLVAPANATVVRADAVDLPGVGHGSLVVAPEVARALDPRLAGKVSYLLVPTPDAATVRSLQDRGFDVAATPAIDPFFQTSTNEVAVDLIFIVAFCSILVALFAYEFLRSEVHMRRREIGIWRSIGMRADDVLALLLGRAAAITLVGFGVGAAFSLGLLFVARTFRHSVLFTGTLHAWQWVVLPVTFLVAGVVGAWLPAWQTSRSVVRDQLEAPA